MPPRLLEELESLLGLDDAMDQLIVARIANPTVWREPLLRVYERLNRPEDPVPSLDLFTD